MDGKTYLKRTSGIIELLLSSTPGGVQDTEHQHRGCARHRASAQGVCKTQSISSHRGVERLESVAFEIGREITDRTESGL